MDNSNTSAPRERQALIKGGVLSPEKIWQAVLGEMEVVLPKTQFATWFKNTALEIEEGGKATVLAPHSFCLSWLKKNKGGEIFTCLKKIESSIRELGFRVKKSDPPHHLTLEMTAAPPRGPADGKRPPKSSPLNGDYTFNNFVVGNNNSLAYAVAKEAAAHPGKAHNPLFIYGGVGLGKTHLAQALGNEIRQTKPEARLVYVSCETFTNDFISSIASRKMSEFKRRYRDTDILIVDDVQFLSSKEGSQEEFFHTYNSLHQNARQIVLTADKSPRAIPALEGRLASRFGGGITVDIQPPNLETRIAILSEKCREKDYLVPDEALEYVAKNISSNIRELEGALNRLVTYCKLNNLSPDLGAAQEILGDIVSNFNKGVDVAEIIKAVCKQFSLSKDELLNRGRKKELIRPRQITVFLIREMTNRSLPEIGKIMGGKDHTTILYAERKIARDIQVDAELKKEIELVRERIGSLAF